MAELCRRSALAIYRDGKDRAVLNGSDIKVAEQRALTILLIQGQRQHWQPRVRHLTGVDLPDQPCTVSEAAMGKTRCLWLRPRQWLLVSTLPLSPADFGELPVSGNLLDVSDRYQTLLISGGNGGNLLASGCSIDLCASVFAVNQCRQTLLEQVPVIVEKCVEHYGEPNGRQQAPIFRVYVERPLVDYLWRWCRCRVSEYA